MTEMEERVLELIPIGKDNAVTQTTLADITGLDTRSIRFIVNSLRHEAPVCSGNEGYWIGNKEDVIKSIKRMQSQIKTLTDSCNALISHIGDE